jgi:hypothetical protein
MWVEGNPEASGSHLVARRENWTEAEANTEKSTPEGKDSSSAEKVRCSPLIQLYLRLNSVTGATSLKQILFLLKLLCLCLPLRPPGSSCREIFLTVC